MSVLAWVLIAIGLAVVEIVSVTFFPIFFTLSALVAMAFAMTDQPDWAQWLVFGAGGLLFSGALRPLAKRQLERGPDLKSRIDALQGRHAVVTTEIDGRAGTGAVQVDGGTWTAVTSGGMLAPSIAAGTDVKIVEVRGATLVVESLDNPGRDS